MDQRVGDEGDGVGPPSHEAGRRGIEGGLELDPVDAPVVAHPSVVHVEPVAVRPAGVATAEGLAHVDETADDVNVVLGDVKRTSGSCVLVLGGDFVRVLDGNGVVFPWAEGGGTRLVN